jgi:hypothetical protein|tara:strand:+ start:541 stop:1815 length:1275 start_codon:yes stop_codon:yes gene_type:complete
MKESALINLKKYSICISFTCNNPIYYFDGEGRLIGGFVDQRNFRRSFTDQLRQQWSLTKNGERIRCYHVLSQNEREAFFEQMFQMVMSIYQDLFKGEDERIQITTTETIRSPRVMAMNWLEKIVAFDKVAREKDIAAFQSIYRPVSILPPDQYLSLVLQLTEGCAYNRCTFCDFYKDRQFVIKSEAEFRDHIAAVKTFFGRSIKLRKSIFLADANALAMPMDQLLPMFKRINLAFNIAPDRSNINLSVWRAKHPIYFNGIYSFIDTFSASQKSDTDFALLRQWNLKRVYIGVETGNVELLHFLRKPGTPELMRETVNTIKAGGVQVGIILLIGVGGKAYFDQHIQDTIQLVDKMNLSRGDLIYLSELVGNLNLEYFQNTAKANIEPLTPTQMKSQTQALKTGFQSLGNKNAPQVSTYNIREFIY